MYSAFYDSRPTLRSAPRLAVVAVLDRRLRRVWCRVWYGADAAAAVVQVRAVLVPAGAGRLTADGRELLEHVVVCPLTTDACAPASVALAWGASAGDATAFRVLVELPAAASHQRHSMAVCVSATYGDVDARRLVEWIEMQQVLGAQLVVIYNHSVSPAAGRVLARYAAAPRVQLRQTHDDADSQRVQPRDDADTPRVELRQTRAFTHDAADALLHMSPVINDCIYRFSAQFHYFAVIDLDELIVPRHVETVPALIAALSARSGAPVALFAFRNAYFFLDIPVSDVRPPSRRGGALSTFLVHRRRLSASPPAYSVKSVVNWAACVAMHNHYCWTYTGGVLASSGEWTERVDVPPRDALLHHYKRCHLDTYLRQPGHCRSAMAATLVDNAVNKYTSALTDRLHRRFAQFNLTNSTAAAAAA